MESFATLIKNRRSIRKFTGQLLNPDQVEMILKAALMAPASKRKNPWQFVVVEDKEMLVKLSACKPAGAAFLKDCGRCFDCLYLYAIAGRRLGIGQLLVPDS